VRVNCMYPRVCMGVGVWVRVIICGRMDVYTHGGQGWWRIWVLGCVYIHTRTYIHTHTYIHTYTHIHTHIHTHTYIYMYTARFLLPSDSHHPTNTSPPTDDHAPLPLLFLAADAQTFLGRPKAAAAALCRLERRLLPLVVGGKQQGEVKEGEEEEEWAGLMMGEGEAAVRDCGVA
jgi:hypothetical protein